MMNRNQILTARFALYSTDDREWVLTEAIRQLDSHRADFPTTDWDLMDFLENALDMLEVRRGER